MGDTEKEADPVGGSGGTEDGGVEGRMWEIEAWVWSDRKCSRQSKTQTNTKTLFTELWQ